MKTYQYIALLRGINVGGNNIISMEKLKACFTKMGFEDVRTYIQSGNVLFKSLEKDTEKLTSKIEKLLSKEFNYKALVVVISLNQLTQVVKNAPKNFGSSDKHRYDVIFLKPPLKAQDAIKEVSTKEEVDTVSVGKGVLYFSRLTEKASQSRMNKIIQSPIYKSITIRNWNTTTKLLILSQEK